MPVGDPAEQATVPAHAELSASSSHRWMACPGSVAASRGIKDEASVHAMAGSVAHDIAAHCLAQNEDPENFLGREQTAPGSDRVFEVDREMVDAIQVYVDEMRRRSAGASQVWVERTFNLRSLGPPAAMYGTSDFVAYWKDTGKLLVGDFKFGAGVAVEAAGNPQLRYYALGALVSAGDLPVSEIEAVIVQPRAGGVKAETIDAVDLMDYAADLLEAAQAAMAKDAPRKAGEHCRWCRAKPHCDELRRFNLATTVAAFDDGELVDEDTDFLGPNLIDDDTLARLLDRASVMEDWLRALREEAFRRMNSGHRLPGWKLVAKRSRRAWRDEAEAESLLEMMGVPDDQVWKRTIVSPAQAEKLVPKGQRGRLSALVVAQSGGPTMAPETDKRPAVEGGGFTALGDDEDTY